MEEEEEERTKTTTRTSRFKFNNHNDLSIFPPINHEDLPIPPPHAPITLDTSDSDSPHSKPPHNSISKIPKWVNFALHLWSSKFLSFLTQLPSCKLFTSFCKVVKTAAFLVGLWLWVRRLKWCRQQRSGHGGQESVEQLKLLIKEKDEKIVQLLEQITQMNKLLLARYRIPVLKPADSQTNQNNRLT